MKEKLKKILSSRIFVTLLALLTSVWVYAPVVAGILIMMSMWMVPAAFTSWRLFHIFGPASWINKWLLLKSNTLGVRILLTVEFLLIMIGLILLVWGLVQIAEAKLKKEGLVTGGIYRYIRHPQHLGMIIIAFAFALYVPGTEDLGIRVGEILSWSLFSLIQFLWSDYEERQLAKKFGDEFNEYRKKTGAFFPRIVNKKKKRQNFDEIIYWKRYMLTFLAYIGFVVIYYIIIYILSLPSINIVTFS